MKIRHTDCDKWEDSWFLELSAEAKLVYQFLMDKCDNAGVWEPNFRVTNSRLKKDVDWDGVLEELGDRIEVLESGYWWLTRFVRFQTGRKPLRPETVPAHRNIVELLERHGIDINCGWITGKRAPVVPIPKRKTGEPAPKQEELFKPEPVQFPPALDCREFHETWELWQKYRRERKLAALKPTSIKAQLDEMAGWGLERAIAAVKLSIRQNWQGIFEEKSNARTNDNRNRSSRSFEHGSDYGGVQEKL